MLVIPATGTRERDLDDLKSICEEIVADLDGALACVVADAATGRAVAAAVEGSALEGQGVDLVSEAASEMFLGRSISRFGHAWNAGGSPAAFIREVQVTTTSTHQFIAAVPEAWDRLLVLVTDKSVSLGIGWMTLRESLGPVGGAMPAAPPPTVPEAPSVHAGSGNARGSLAPEPLASEPVPTMHAADANAPAPNAAAPAPDIAPTSAPAAVADALAPDGPSVRDATAVPVREVDVAASETSETAPEPDAEVEVMRAAAELPSAEPHARSPRAGRASFRRVVAAEAEPPPPPPPAPEPAQSPAPANVFRAVSVKSRQKARTGPRGNMFTKG